MNYEAWRISYQSSEQAARAAYAECVQLHVRIEALEKERDALRAELSTEKGWIEDYKKQIVSLQNRLEATEHECTEQARLNGIGAEREAALMAKLEAAEKSDAESIAMYRKARDERDALRAAVRHEADCVEAAMAEIKSLRAKLETAENDAAHQKALAASALRVAKGWEDKCDELRAKIGRMEKRLHLILEEPENTMSNSKAMREMIKQARLALEESK